jgi:hypothetical protein
MPPGMAAAMADVSAVKQEPAPQSAATSMGPPRAGASDRKPRKIDMMLQTLKRCMPAGEPCRACMPACVPCVDNWRSSVEHFNSSLRPELV